MINYRLFSTSYLGIFFLGMAISFIGTIPFGNLNLTALQIASLEGSTESYQFVIGIVLVEIFYLTLLFYLLNQLIENKIFMRWVRLIAYFFLLVYFFLNFFSLFEENSHEKNIILQNTLPRFFLGFLMSFLNPIQIPFWLNWLLLLFFQKNKKSTSIYRFIFISGVGIGTFLGFVPFIELGTHYIEGIKKNIFYLNTLITLIIFGVLLFQSKQIYQNFKE